MRGSRQETASRKCSGGEGARHWDLRNAASYPRRPSTTALISSDWSMNILLNLISNFQRLHRCLQLIKKIDKQRNKGQSARGACGTRGGLLPLPRYALPPKAKRGTRFSLACFPSPKSSDSDVPPAPSASAHCAASIVKSSLYSMGPGRGQAAGRGRGKARGGGGGGGARRQSSGAPTRRREAEPENWMDDEASRNYFTKEQNMPSQKTPSQKKHSNRMPPT